MAFPESSVAEAAVELIGGEASEPVPHKPLSVRDKILFAVGDTMDGFNTTAVATFHLFYLTAVCGLSGSLAGASVFISLMIDGFVDPLIGSLSDNWHSRLGRRHPFLFASILPLVLTLGLTFSVPRGLTGFWLFAYATVVILTMRIAYSAFSLPFLAMGAELTGDYVERSRLIVYRVFFNTMANLLTTFLGYRVFMAGSNGLLNRAAYIPFGWSVAIMMGIGMLICAFGTLDQRYRLHSPARSSAHIGRRLIAEVIEIFRSRSFVVLFAVVLLFWISQGSAAVLALEVAERDHPVPGYFGRHGWSCRNSGSGTHRADVRKADRGGVDLDRELRSTGRLATNAHRSLASAQWAAPIWNSHRVDFHRRPFGSHQRHFLSVHDGGCH
jgi:GPH family glycoside/pentoside/hexuronide:cation symporter